jgi:drug/metabolite transporter (DMT)-like permease
MKSKALLFLAVLSLIWGASFLFIKVGVESIPLFTFVAGRMAMGAALLYVLLRLRGMEMPRPGREWVPFVVIGFLNALIPYVLIAWGEQHISSGLAAILNGATPVFTALMAHFLTTDERLTAGKILGIMLGFVGTVIVMLPEIGDGFTFDLLGQLAVLGGALGYALAILYARRRLRGMPPIKTSIGMLASGFVLTLPLVLVFEDPLAARPGLAALGSWLTLGVFGTAFAYLLYYWLIENAGATYTSLVTFILPPMGVFWGALLLSQKIHWTSLIGLVVIILGIVAINGYLDRFLPAHRRGLATSRSSH